MANNEENKKTARKFFELFQKGDVKGVEALWGNGYKLHFPGSPNTLSPEQSKKNLQEYIEAFPDKVFNIEDQVAEGDTVVTRFTVKGTHKGSFQGVAPTGKKLNSSGIAVHRISNGKIVEEWANFDQMGMMQQIGAIPEMAHHNHNGHK